jgi:hypothetical protein
MGITLALIAVLALVVLPVVTVSAETGGLRHVVPSKVAGQMTTEYALWSSAESADLCARAWIGGTAQDRRRFCEEGVVPGVKPRVGALAVGMEVELLDSRECRRMAHVRVLTGPLKGKTGCIAAQALSSIKPESTQ